MGLSVGKNVGNKMDGASGAKMETGTDFAVDKDMKEMVAMARWEKNTNIPVFKTQPVSDYTHLIKLLDPFVFNK